jgi:predicted DNA-binding WGR domain protein
MAKKLEKSKFPEGHGPNDFKCFGPAAMNDGEFEGCKIADMGSFSQDEKDSNKMYHAAVVQSKINGKWYIYFEWGRVGATSPQFQMAECRDEAEAQREFAAQCHEKNDKRGVWTTIAGVRTLTAKPGKDVYLVRQLATRSTGLPDAKTIKNTEGVKAKTVPNPPDDASNGDKKAKKVSVKKQQQRVADPHTTKLLKDLIGGTISYTRGSMADDSIPTQLSIDTARIFLTEAQKRLLIVGDNLDDQIADKELRTLSGELYKRIPKKKPVNAPDRTWILSKDNIVMWQSDLDAFESALSSHLSQEINENVVDPFHGLPLHMEWVDPSTDLGKFLYFWWPKATANRHYHLKEMKIKNMWKVDRHGDADKIRSAQKEILKEIGKSNLKERPLFQPSERFDVVDNDEREVFARTNTCLLFHGTRSINVKGILEKSLMMPKQLVGVSLNGAMFGPGIYWADDWKKSAGYTSLSNSLYASSSGGVAGRHAFMFAADVVVGQPFVAPRSHGYTAAPSGHHCVFGKGRYHDGKSSSGVENNEWIIYKNTQNRLRYLVEFAA